jgi:hypothetical protein
MIREPRQSLFFDPRPHRWTGKFGSGNDEWFFFPLRVIILLLIIAALIGAWL